MWIEAYNPVLKDPCSSTSWYNCNFYCYLPSVSLREGPWIFPRRPYAQLKSTREGTLTIDVENIVINKLCGTTHWSSSQSLLILNDNGQFARDND